MSNQIDIIIKAKDETGGAFQSTTEKTRALEKEVARMQSKQMKLNAAVGGIRNLATGNVESLNSLQGSFGKVGNAIAQAGLLVGTFVAAWKTGIKIQEKLWSSFVDSIESGSAAAAESIKALAGAMKANFSGAIETIGKSVSALIEKSKEAGSEAARVNQLNARRVKAESTIAGTDAPAQALSDSGAKAARSEIARLRQDAATIQAEVEKAVSKSQEALEKYAGAGGRTAEVQRAIRKASQDAQKEAQEVAEAGAKAIAEIQKQIQEQQVKAIEARAMGVEAIRKKEKDIADTQKKAEEDAAEAAKERAAAVMELAGVEQQRQAIGMEEKREAEIKQIDGADKQINAAQERLAELDKTREQRQAEKQDARRAELDAEKLARIKDKAAGGSRISAGEQRTLDRANAMDAMQMAKDQKAIAEENIRVAEQMAEKQNREAQLLALQAVEDKLNTLLQAM